ncbi:cytochrome P450 [Fomitiporia mediterranea MF3/22]|uniref:cytochrome P450 n=1 Tax=Fomitiporia mediterranea (strain MF3/22) TaxID=694068 RepID=UPI00044092ED|nr:cytochrome P450 [Fomitiporia mediterranea MF3/22]EJD03454.1 cytochrome P450 [Fomitiporia mediterranea MF3/22]
MPVLFAFSPGLFCWLAIDLLCGYIATIALYQLFFSPLRSVPGPWYAAVSDFWLTTHILRLRRCRAINDLLLKYGPIIRVAPNKVIFLDAPTMKVVYGVSSKLSKTMFYKSLTTNANDHAMTTLEHGPHLARKRGYVAHYSPSNLALFQSEFYNCVNHLTSVISASASMSATPIDTLLLFRHFFIDINCTHLFAYEAGSLKSWSEHILHGCQPDELSRAIYDFPKRGLLRSVLPKWLWNALEQIPIYRWQQFCDSDARLGRFGFARLNEMRVVVQSGKAECTDTQREPLITRLIRHKYSEQEAMPDKDIVSECIGHLIAGTDTTTTTLSYILWELSRRRDVMLRLQAETDEYMPDPTHVPDIQDLQKLPYLTAVIKESLRIYSAGPSPLERVAPATPNAELALLGHSIPGGTIIASQAYSSHRHPGVFFCPDLFLPDRWLLEDLSPDVSRPNTHSCSSTLGTQPQSSTPPQFRVPSPALSDAEKGSNVSVTSTLKTSVSQAQMAAHMFPFGHGPRVCGGQNLAQFMLRVVLTAIARNFDLVAPPETNERSMAIRDSFVIFPAALECKLIFVPRTPSSASNRH